MIILIRIGIVMDYCHKENRFFINSAYVDKIIQAKGLPVLLAYTENNLLQVLKSVEGVVLAGGGDPDPIYFGAEPIPRCGQINPNRDKFEVELAKRCLSENIPLLGICRGAQIMNIAAGGDIYQDIASSMKIQHQQQAPRWHPTHMIDIAPESMLHRIFNVAELRVNSFHHQSINKVAPEFRISGMARDGIIEAIERKQGFAIGVQWHPEELNFCIHLFHALVDAAAKSSLDKRQ